MKIKDITLVGALVNCSRYYGRKRARCCSLDTGWLLILVLYPGCTAIENNRPIKLPSNVQASQAQKDDKTQWASNAQGTLFGENMGDFIILQWSLNDSATEYFVYRSTSPNGPWEQTGRFSQGAARTGGAKIDDTPDARLMDLCYKVEAIDAKGLVIEFYEPICVPLRRARLPADGLGSRRYIARLNK